MVVNKPLEPAQECTQVFVSDKDWDQADPDVLSALYAHMEVIRRFEECVLDLSTGGLVHGPAHSSIGQEGGAAGSILALAQGDQINGSHRGHHQFLAKGLAHLGVNGFDPAFVTPEVVHFLRRTLAEILGLAQGFCGGRGGSMHLRWVDAGALGTNAIVGGGVPAAAGAAWAHKTAGTDSVMVTYLGDGAVNIGSTLETFNLAAAWKLPLCFFVENNQYAVATTVEESTGESRLAARGLGFGIRSWRVDGMDPLAVFLTMNEALAYMRAGRGPTLIEADVYRFFHQNGAFPGSAFGYRSKAEEDQWRARDPLPLIVGHMVRRDIATDFELKTFGELITETMAEVVTELTTTETGDEPAGRRIRSDLWPRPEFRDVGIRSDLSELEGVRKEEEATYQHPLKPQKFVDVVANVMARRMASDPSIIVIGEDVHRLKGGTNGATRGLSESFPGRVLGTPISEAAFLGLGGGIATDGRFRPVVEFMYPDFVWVAADQVFNQVGKVRHMFGGNIDVPLVLRTKVAMGTGYGSQHSMDPAGVFVTSPGWRIAAPATPFDYVGMMNAALACNDPVLLIEHVDLYGSVGDAPEEDLDYLIPPRHAALRRTGTDLTVISYLSMVSVALEAVDQLGVDAEVIDLRWLDPASLDWDTVESSIRKTNSVLIVEQGARGTSYGGWLADEIQRRCFDWLDQPIERVTGAEAAPSISRVLEESTCAGVADVIEALRRVIHGFGG